MKIFKHQLWHFLLLVALLACVYTYTCMDAAILKGELWGISTLTWFVLALLSPIVHQLYVLLCWRYELYYSSVSKFFGKKGFGLYKKGFAILILSRPITLILLAISNAYTLPINTLLSYILSGMLLIPAIYLFYSVKKYFGFDRAFGIDHFDPERFKSEPMIKQGIFKYSANAMYVFGFMILWVPGILLQSKAAVLLALFNHIYIWVHYYFTELPDMKMIYKEDSL